MIFLAMAFAATMNFEAEPTECYHIDEPNPTHDHVPFKTVGPEGNETRYYNMDGKVVQVVRYDYEEICLFEHIKKK